MRKVLVGFIISLFAPAAFAQPYFGANFVDVSYDEDGFETANPTALAIRGGYQINQNFAVEGRIGTGVADDEVRVSGVDVAVEVDNFVGVYARGLLPTGTIFTPYALVGYTRGELSGSASGVTVSADDSDVSFGFGADFAIKDRMGINAEWARLFKGEGFEVDGISIGFFLKF